MSIPAQNRDSSRRRARPASNADDDMMNDEKQDESQQRPMQLARIRPQERPIVFSDQVWTRDQYDTICLDPNNADQSECALKAEIVSQECKCHYTTRGTQIRRVRVMQVETHPTQTTKQLNINTQTMTTIVADCNQNRNA